MMNRRKIADDVTKRLRRLGAPAPSDDLDINDAIDDAVRALTVFCGTDLLPDELSSSVALIAASSLLSRFDGCGDIKTRRDGELTVTYADGGGIGERRRAAADEMKRAAYTMAEKYRRLIW